MVDCLPYTDKHKKSWDEFVMNCRTPLFFFQRDYMEYHQHRFIDHSLMFYLDEKLIALFPACRINDTLNSHGGLTYGGLLIDGKIRSETVRQVAQKLLIVAREQGFRQLIYKAIPYVFYQQPAQDDIFFLLNQAKGKIYRRDLSSVIELKGRIGLSKGRKALIARAKKHGLQASSSQDWNDFYSLLQSVLQKHQAVPVHTAEELQYLYGKYPDNIELKVVKYDDQMIAAVVLFKFQKVIHTQYMATSELGKNLGALDYLIEHCIVEGQLAGADYFNFGISTEQNGLVVNEGLLSQKEGFGARSICLDFYEVNISD